MTKFDTFAPLVAAYLANNHAPGAELVFRSFSTGDEFWGLAAAFYVKPDAARYLESATAPGYRYQRLGVEVVDGRRFKITFIQTWHRGEVEDTIHSDGIYDVH